MEIEIKEKNYSQLISNKLGINEKSIINTLKLIQEENTIPFIARYRKEISGNLDENQIREILEIKKKEEKLYESKLNALENINKQEKLNPELQKNIINALTLKEVEDLYKPFKLKKKTKAMIAIEKGFDIISKQIKNQEEIKIPQNLLDKYPQEEIIQGGRDILIQEISDDFEFKNIIRNYYKKKSIIMSSYKKNLDDLSPKIKEQVYKFEIYDNFEINIDKIKAYQILAMNRGENLNILSVKINKDDEAEELLTKEIILKQINIDELKFCIKEAYKKIFSSIEIEIRNLLNEKAQIEAIKTFQTNLYKLLMTKPQYDKIVLAIDPGFRTGCKIAIINKENKPLDFNKIYLEKKESSINIIKSFIEKYKLDVIVIGNGTASNETYEFIKENFNLPISIVNESGASVYSASEIANEEFPNLDLTDRGTISIGRRFIDPLAEFLKIPVISIGVGMYQHDMNQKELETKLSYVIEDVVNLVGINVNTASIYLLKEISGLNLKSAKKIYNNKPYKNREELKNILSSKAYEQAIGFLRVVNSKEELDNTSIHPEQYGVAKFIIKNQIKSYQKYEKELKSIYPLINEKVYEDIILAYNDMGKDPRKFEAILNIEKTLNIEDLKIGDIINGVVRNILQFGVFVDIGIKNDGLIHISELADKFIKDPHEIVEIGQNLKVKVIGIDLEKGKVKLSLKF